MLLRILKLKNNILFPIAILLLLVFASFRFVVPSWVAWNKNRIELSPPYKVSAEASELHQSLTIADLHADTLLWGRNILKRSKIGHIDLPRLIDGNVSLQVFSVVTKTPKALNLKRNDDKSDNITLLALAQGWSWKSLSSLSERALYQAHQLHDYADKSDGELILIKSAKNLEDFFALRKNNHNIVAGLLSLEGAHALEGKIENLNKLYQAGFRILGLTHFFDNDVGGSAHGLKKEGLTEFGRKVVKHAQAMHMLIDLSHASSKLIQDVLEISTQPVVVSHTGVKGTCDRSRNLTDDQILGVAKTGGLIGIGFWPTAICGHNAREIAQAAHYAKNIAGIEHIALGSDFDGAVSVPFDISGLSLLTEALLNEGFSQHEIRLFMGGNVVKLFLNAL